jgi:hypothetical protein
MEWLQKSNPWLWGTREVSLYSWHTEFLSFFRHQWRSRARRF